MADYSPADYYTPPKLLTDEDRKRANDQAWGEYGTAAGGALAVGLGQLGLSTIDTSGEVMNKAELAKLQALQRKNKLGLGDDVKQEYERALMNPVRSAVSASERAESARLAAMGRGSAADVVRAQRVAQDRLTDAAIRAGTQIEEANIAERARQKEEIESRLASESARERQQIDLAAQTLTGLAQNFARVSAANPSRSRITDGQIVEMASATNAKGEPMYPGLRGLSLADARALIEAGDTQKLMGYRAMQGTVAPSGPSEGG